jgi:transketolase
LSALALIRLLTAEGYSFDQFAYERARHTAGINMTNIEIQMRQARARLLQMHYESGVGHIGGNLSCLDLMIVLHHQFMSERDQFVLSKGHAAGALYVTLWTKAILNDEDLRQFHQDNTKLSGHPSPHFIPQIPFATGSLGHGLSLACGLALGKRLKNEPGRVFCLLSDGEWQEGSCWEALIFAAHHRLALTLVVDTNGLQGFGTTLEIAGQDILTAKFAAFGVLVREIDGHNVQEIQQAFSSPPEGVCAIVARTCKGSGVSFMENRMEWHYLPLNSDLYEQACREITEP